MLLSVIVLKEAITPLAILGGALILGSTLACEIIKDKKEKKVLGEEDGRSE